MANIHSQKKRILRAERERLENRRYTSKIKTYFRRLEQAVAAGEERLRVRERDGGIERLTALVDCGDLQIGAKPQGAGIRRERAGITRRRA